MKPDKFWIIIFALITAVCTLMLLFIYNAGRSSPGSAAYIYSDGKLIETVDLEALSAPRTIPVHSQSGVNIIEAEYGRVRVLEADCANGTCIRQGWASGSPVPLVCLPNRLVILVDGSHDIDGAVG